MRHNIMLTTENSSLLKKLGADMGLKPSAVISMALRALKKQEAENKEKSA